MRSIKTYKSFINESKEDLDFEFLVSVGKMKEAIIKIVELHEKHHYNDTKISSYDKFKQSVSDLIDMAVGGKQVITENYLAMVKMFEKELYGKQLIFTSEESLFSCIDDLILRFNNLLDNENRDEEDIEGFREDSEHFLVNMDDSWIYKDYEEVKPKSTKDMSAEEAEEMMSRFNKVMGDIEDKLKEPDDDVWSSEEEFEKDMLDYIGKPMKDFDYSDRLQAYKYIENKPWVKSALEGGNKSDKEYIQNFLSQIKDNFGI